MQRKMKLPFIFFLGLSWVFLLGSCTKKLEDLAYFHSIENETTFDDTSDSHNYLIRPNDNLYIRIIGDDPQAIAYLNLGGIDRNFTTESSIELVSYIVSSEGIITLPFLGDVNVAGKTLSQVKKIIKEQVEKHMSNTSVVVKLVNRTITVLGEVRKPGQYRIIKNRVTIFEALGYAGDVNDYGNRKTVKLIRQEEGQKKVVVLDLTDSGLIESPYYNILPNDLVYVEPTHRVYGAKTLSFTTIFSVFSTLFSGILLVNSLTD